MYSDPGYGLTHHRYRRALCIENLERRLCLSANVPSALAQVSVAPNETAVVIWQMGDTAEPSFGTGIQSSNLGLTGSNHGWIAYQNNLVSIQGTNLQDNVQVQYAQSFGGAPTNAPTNWVRVSLSNAYGTQTRYFSTSAANQIEFFAQDGNDIFNNVTHIGSLVEGGAGHDSLSGGSGSDDFRGRAGNDLLRGNGGNDLLYGGDDWDYLEGGSGHDILAGNDDWDRLFGDGGNDLLSGGLGDDELEGGNGDDYVYGDNGHDALYGNGGNDNLFGGDGKDIAVAGSGSDAVWGGDDSDILQGDAGPDQLWGGNADDEIYGGSGNDAIYGGDGNDMLAGGTGGDELWGQWGNDNIDGGSGDDTLNGGSDADSLSGGEGDDSLFGHGGEDSLYGGDGNDFLAGGDGADYIHAGSGNDTAYGDGGRDRIYGFAGHDYLVGGDGNDKLVAGDGNDSLFGSAGNDELQGQAGDDFLYGESGNDVLWGHAGNDHLAGGSGDDDLMGGDGSDNLEGGTGLDGLFGGRGNNTLTGGSDADRILTFDTNGNAYSVFADTNDEVLGNTSADAVIKFLTGDLMWDDSEVLSVDAAFALLHRHAGTRHTRLLKSSGGGSLTFIRRNVITSDELPSGYPVGNYDARAEAGSKVHISQRLLDKSDAAVLDIVIHELGHFWQNQPSFMAISGWTKNPDRDNWMDYMPAGQGGWYYSVDAIGGFLPDDSPQPGVMPYSTTNPGEDFATTFAYFFTEATSHANSVIQEKLDWMTVFLKGLA